MHRRSRSFHSETLETTDLEEIKTVKLTTSGMELIEESPLLKTANNRKQIQAPSRDVSTKVNLIFLRFCASFFNLKIKILLSHKQSNAKI